MAAVSLYVISALDNLLGPHAKALWPICLPKCRYDLEAHLGHITTCIKCIICEISSSYSLQCILLILCKYVTDIKKICMKKIIKIKKIDKFTAFIA